MAYLWARLPILPLVIQVALGQSVKSCGGPNDHLQNPVIKLTPDPIQKGSTLTIEASGTLDEEISALNANLDLHVQALGIIKASVKGAMPLSFAPAAVKGPFNLTVGPLSIPSKTPGNAVVKGQVHVVDGNSQPVMCIDLDVDVMGENGEEAPRPPLQLAAAAPATISSCGQASDHLQDFAIATSGGVTTISGTLDEAVGKAAVDVDVSVKVLFIHVPMKVSIPVAFSPSAPKTAIRAALGPSTVTFSPEVRAELKGMVKLSDGSAEEIACLNVDSVIGGDERIVV